MDAAAKTLACNTKRADQFLQSLHVDEHDNVHATVTANESNHNTILNKRLTGRYDSLNKVKTDLVQLKDDILKFLSDQIIDQHEDHSVGWLMSAFDLESTEDLPSRLEKISKLHELYGIEREHEVEEQWFDYRVILIHKPRLRCNEANLRKEFEKAYSRMNVLSQELRSGGISSQMEAWRKFFTTSLISYLNLCQLLEVMISVAVNTGWIERAHIILENI